MKILNLINYLIGQSYKQSEVVDLERLQKLLLFIQGYSLSEFNVPVFEYDIKFRTNQPLVTEVSQLFKNYSFKFTDQKQVIEEPKYPINLIYSSIIKEFYNTSNEEIDLIISSILEINNIKEIVSKETLKSFFKLEV